MENPWNIHSIYELQYFNCPSCTFKNHLKQEIINHACEIHPKSVKFLKNIIDNSLEDVVCPWNDPFGEIDMEKGMEDNQWNVNSIYELHFFNCRSCIFKSNSKQEIVTHACEFHPESMTFLQNVIDNSLADVICPWNNHFVDVNM